MISADWELTAALAVLEQAEQEAAALHDNSADRQALDVAQRRCGSAQSIVERIRTSLHHDLAHCRNECAPPASLHGDFQG